MLNCKIVKSGMFNCFKHSAIYLNLYSAHFFTLTIFSVSLLNTLRTGLHKCSLQRILWSYCHCFYVFFALFCLLLHCMLCSEKNPP